MQFELGVFAVCFNCFAADSKFPRDLPSIVSVAMPVKTCSSRPDRSATARFLRACGSISLCTASESQFGTHLKFASENRVEIYDPATGVWVAGGFGGGITVLKSAELFRP